ncbi:hypothetical protein E6O75_ATG04253 [Venturia nashicola]|uniref:Uncharacterized protein n=1 Tax=Venturia nashicola TaxID=86259 RepID=A0A4Z1PA45_9PEZI|nr:hypothetical protein E6O75_ATG04253 [Venturia nashicola]
MPLKVIPLMVTSTHPNPRATFLTLPSELRQSILLQSLDTDFAADDVACKLAYYLQRLCAHHLNIWVWLFLLEHVHGDILNDVRYVANHIFTLNQTHELRQAILAESRKYGVPCIKAALGDHVYQPWAAVLEAVDPKLSDDINFTAKKWKASAG